MAKKWPLNLIFGKHHFQLLLFFLFKFLQGGGQKIWLANFEIFYNLNLKVRLGGTCPSLESENICNGDSLGMQGLHFWTYGCALTALAFSYNL